MDFLSTLRDARAGQAAQEAARMHDVAALAKQQGASEYAQGLARLAAEQGYMDATNPQVGEPRRAPIRVYNPYTGQVDFVPAGLAAYKTVLDARNTPSGSLADVPVKIVGDNRQVPAEFKDRSGFGKALEIVAQSKYDPFIGQ